MPLSSKRKAELRAEAHHLRPIVQVGRHGLTDAVRQSVDDALRTRELVKIQLGRESDVGSRDAADALATALDADVVQVIGRTLTLFRANPERAGGTQE